MANDILHQMLVRTLNDMYLMLNNKSLILLGMTTPFRPVHIAFNQEFRRKTQYDSQTLKETVLRNVPLLYEQQKYVYDTIMNVMNVGIGGFCFLVSPGGTGKTLWYHSLRQQLDRKMVSHLHLIRQVL